MGGDMYTCAQIPPETIPVPYLWGPHRPSVFTISVKNRSLAFIFQIFEYPTKLDDQIFEHLGLINTLALVIKYGQGYAGTVKIAG